MVDYRKKKAKIHQARQGNSRRNRQKTPVRASLRSVKSVARDSEVHGERLQKVLANIGLGSRRGIDEMIAAGKVLVNKKPAVVGQRVHHGDRVIIGGQRHIVDLAPRTPKVVIYHKPEGQIVSKDDPEGRPSIFDHLPKLRHGRWIPIGRLDFNTCGLLLLTTSGQLADHFMHPRYEVEREYAVRIRGPLAEDQIEALKNGVLLEDGMAAVDSITGPFGNDEEKNHWYHIVLKEGRNREVRRLFSAVNANLTRLMRVRFGTVRLPSDLRRGCTQELTQKEVASLIKENFPDESAFLLKGEAPKQPITSFDQPMGNESDHLPTGTFDERPAKDNDGYAQENGFAKERRSAENSDEMPRFRTEHKRRHARSQFGSHRVAKDRRTDEELSRPGSLRALREGSFDQSREGRASSFFKPRETRSFNDRPQGNRDYRNNGANRFEGQRNDRGGRYPMNGNRNEQPFRGPSDRPRFGDRSGYNDRPQGNRDYRNGSQRFEGQRNDRGGRYPMNGNRSEQGFGGQQDRPRFNRQDGNRGSHGFTSRSPGSAEGQTSRPPRPFNFAAWDKEEKKS